MVSMAFFSCESDNTTQTPSENNIALKDSLLIYEGTGSHDGKDLDVSLFLPELRTGAAYQLPYRKAI
jgi:hypothetical protein